MSVGGLSLGVAVAAGLLTVIAGVVGRRGSRPPARLAAPSAALLAALVAAIAASVSTITLALAFVGEHWHLAYVVDHTRSGIGPLLRLAGLWAGPEGSLLLWTTATAWAVAIAIHLAPDPTTRRGVARIGGLLTTAYALVVAVVASPFTRLDLPAVDGLGLQPILEHPAMVWHPPLLYAGLVGLLMPSLVVAAAGWTGRAANLRIPASWWTIPLGLLAAGLLTGSRWAHGELGWGGYWAWDPIESAGLTAWLAGAAALHLRDRGIGSPWVRTAVGVLPGLAAIWATTLTRIGVVSSVHAFADRPTLRISLLAVAAIASALLLGAIVRTAVSPGVTTRARTQLGRRGSGMGRGGRVLFVAAFFVAAGTYRPLVEAVTNGDRMAVAGTYFTRLLWPVVIVGCGAAVAADRRWWPALGGAAAGAVLVPPAVGPFGLILAAAGGAMAASALWLLRTRRPGAVAHLGVGLLLIGVAGTLATRSTTVRLEIDRPTELDGFELVHRGVTMQPGTATSRAVAEIEIDGRVLRPSVETFHLRGVSTAEVAHQSRGLDEIQVVLVNADRDQARYRISYFPRLHLVWIGGALTAVALLAQPLRRLRARSWATVEASPPSSPAPSVGGPGAAEVGGGDSGAAVEPEGGTATGGGEVGREVAGELDRTAGASVDGA